jgi:hypothetical protein
MRASDCCGHLHTRVCGQATVGGIVTLAYAGKRPSGASSHSRMRRVCGQATVGGTATTRWGADNETVDAIDEYPRILASHSARDDTARLSLPATPPLSLARSRCRCLTFACARERDEHQVSKWAPVSKGRQSRSTGASHKVGASPKVGAPARSAGAHAPSPRGNRRKLALDQGASEEPA